MPNVSQGQAEKDSYHRQGRYYQMSFTVPQDPNASTLSSTDSKPKRAGKSVPTPVSPGSRSTWMNWNWTELLQSQGQDVFRECHLSPSTSQQDAPYSPCSWLLSGTPVPSLNLICIGCFVIVFGVVSIIYGHVSPMGTAHHYFSAIVDTWMMQLIPWIFIIKLFFL